MSIDTPAWFATLNLTDPAQEEKAKLAALIDALNERDLPNDFLESAADILTPEPVSATNSPDLDKAIKAKRVQLLRLAQVKMNLSAPGHFRSQWTALGMTVFGVPIGLALSTATGNFGLLAVGLPIGLSMGIAIGSSMDTKAKQENRQLAI